MPPRLPSLRIILRPHNRSTAWRNPRRPYSSPNQTAEPSKHHHRFQKVHARLPRFLQRFTQPLLNAPITHITSFILLHELTAIIPLFTLAGYFHYTHWLPPYISEGKWVSDGVEKFGRYFRRKGWLGEAGEIDDANSSVGNDGKNHTGRRALWWGRGEGGVRLVVEFATAYAITKALLPARLVISVWGTPWFARTAVVPVGRVVGRLFGRGKKKVDTSATSTTVKAVGNGSPGAGTGTTAAGAVGKDIK